MLKYLRIVSVLHQRAACLSDLWTGSAGQLKLYGFAIIMITALSVQSCRTAQTLTMSEKTEQKESVTDLDSLSEVVVERRVSPVAVPLSEVILDIPTDSLFGLPPGAAYTKKSGQARISVNLVRESRGNNGSVVSGTRLIVVGTCDSLQLQGDEYEKTIVSLKKKLQRMESQNKSSEEKTVKRKKPPSYFLLLMLFAAGIGIVWLRRKL